MHPIPRYHHTAHRGEPAIAEQMAATSLWVNMAPTLFLLVVFVLIYAANGTLQRGQHTALGIARVARRYWIEALRHGDTGPSPMPSFGRSREPSGARSAWTPPRGCCSASC